ncbi:hypothetical protein EST38_g13174 [Candolleomyces aberdarensis]|uniref:Uncharacterized protein n=1 Tax=Candolleomyces aberdarensis TaxID=2316362 RepID=A0A4Q2D0H6_9AGAR|nr:hypothetical protein EST38_g13174 [Candolleomyces aberdarensis]
MVFEAIRPEFRPVLDELIRPLQQLFKYAMENEGDMKTFATCDRLLTVGTFMEAINVTPRKWV